MCVVKNIAENPLSTLEAKLFQDSVFSNNLVKSK